MPSLGRLVLWLVVVACLVLACASIAHWGWPCQRRCRACPCFPTLVRPVPRRGQARWIGGGRWQVPRRRRLSERRRCFSQRQVKHILLSNITMLFARVVIWDPARYNNDMHMVFRLGCGEGKGIMSVRPVPPPPRKSKGNFFTGGYPLILCFSNYSNPQ